MAEALIKGVPKAVYYAQWAEAREREKVRKRSAPARGPGPQQASREQRAAPIDWFDFPTPLVPGSGIKVVGVADDAPKALKFEWGVLDGAGAVRDGEPAAA
jgi:hypothetical protein